MIQIKKVPADTPMRIANPMMKTKTFAILVSFITFKEVKCLTCKKKKKKKEKYKSERTQDDFILTKILPRLRIEPAFLQV